MKILFLLDGMALVYRGYFALSKHPRITSKGLNTSAVLGFFNTLLEILRKENPSHLGVAFDTQEPTARHLQFADYKAHREKMPEDIATALPYIKSLLEALHIPVLVNPGYEADDIIGTLSVKASEKGYTVYMVTSDKDFGQLVSQNVFMYRPSHTGTGFEIMGEKEVCEKFGIKNTKQVIDLLGLWGDTSDNIPGVPGVGQVTARKLLEQFGSIENMYAHTSEIANEKLRIKIEENKKNAFDSRMLATIILDVPTDFNEDDLRICPPDIAATKAILDELEMVNFGARLLEYYSSLFEVEKAASTTRVPDLFGERPAKMASVAGVPDLFSSLDEQVDVALDAQASTDISPHTQKTSSAKQYVQAQQERHAIDLTGENHITINLKDHLHTLAKKGIFLEEKDDFFDLRLASYLLNPETPLSIADPSLQQSAIKAAELKQQLKEQHLEDFFYNVEMPLVWVLFRMEREGIKIDVEQLEKFSHVLANQMAQMENEIHFFAGHNFNIASPKQLGVVLFEELKITDKAKATKRSKQYDTAEDVLEKLYNKHPIIPYILQYRKLAKLKSTYVDALPLLADKNGRIHTTYNQTATSTGRLSSKNPNLQNIPIRTELGREVRKAFIADSSDDLLLSADYSQIELRIAASMSGDPIMLADFAAGHDIHLATAANIFGVPLDRVTNEMRSKAKTVNFGITYGMSAHGLADRLNIRLREAADIINKYFNKYTTLKKFLDSIIENARINGYVETLWGRRRYIPNVSSGNSNVRTSAGRYAINAPIQGSSADMIKVAMVNIDKVFRQENLKSKMLLQVHDELVFNVKKNEEEKVSAIVKEEMIAAGSKLIVPIVVEIKSADNWLDAH
ncbi:MAG: DNA polymerase I [Bacteroidales bacterium]|jgi:DNA polymerase-1|nr:DNA polymerase I [Bacteroidales bacterium]